MAITEIYSTTPVTSCRPKTDAELKDMLIELYGNRTLRGVERDEAIRDTARLICDLGTSEVSSMRTQGRLTLVFAIVGGTAGILGSIAHENATAFDNPTHAVWLDTINWLRESNAFVRPFCATISTTSQMLGQWSETSCRAETAKYANDKELASRVMLSQAQSEKAFYDKQADNIHRIVGTLLHSNSLHG